MQEQSEQYDVLEVHMTACRSSDNLVSIEENERHCVAGGGLGGQGRLPALTSSTSSLSSGGWEENGEGEEEREEFGTSLQLPECENKFSMCKI